MNSAPYPSTRPLPSERRDASDKTFPSPFAKRAFMYGAAAGAGAAAGEARPSGTPFGSEIRRSGGPPCGRRGWQPRVTKNAEVRQDAPHDPGIVDRRDHAHSAATVRTGQRIHGK